MEQTVDVRRYAIVFKNCSSLPDARRLAVPLDLSQLDRSVLVRSPLTSVIFQLTFDHTARASEAEVARAFHDALGGPAGPVPVLQQITEGGINLALGPNVPPAFAQQPAAIGWQLESADGGVRIRILPTYVSVEASRYEGWEGDFAPRLEQVLGAVDQQIHPVFEQRLGLRYINQITEPVGGPEGWQEWIDERLLGIATHQEIGPMIVFSRQQVVLQLDEQARCTLNHGFAPDPEHEGALTYLLDYDVAREGVRRFDSGQIRETADLFNSYALRLFQLSSTPSLRQHLAA
jgi:uncharacterized protein (TIGR04255 family)